ncbi:hypothetical protein EGW08_020671 [Elysia chlorotica]|uniref:Protein xylosyltransferase n=1 Tax=Elysia chlorotica TaxID=188477 RepID=A0A433SQP0_ELYCH|nr:hypothetical protein EGW08_020671 [Elysia chlorotica]
MAGFSSSSHYVESQKQFREASPLNLRQQVICAIMAGLGFSVFITIHIFFTLVTLDSNAAPNIPSTDTLFQEHEPALKYDILSKANEKWPELIHQDQNISNNAKKFKEFGERFFRRTSKKFQQSSVDCSALYAGDARSVRRAVGISKVLASLEKVKHAKSERTVKLKWLESIPRPPKLVEREVKTWPTWEFQRLTNLWYVRATRNCERFIQTRGYITSPLTLEEEEFPIAFSLIVYKDIEMVERLLRSVYRPQNRYCIHVDLKADPEFLMAVKAVARCFRDNVRMSSERVAVKWGTFSVLEPELICMRDLLAVDSGQAPGLAWGWTKGGAGRERPKWKYFLTLTGQEFPLKTNFELVKILKAFNGANNQEGTIETAEKERWEVPPPHGIRPVKGSIHTIINRATVDFIINSPVAKDFLAWLWDTKFPDETLFASINYNPQLGIPGTYNGSDMERVTQFARFKKWYIEPWVRVCPSRLVVRDICILSIGDLRDLAESPNLFANKFFLDQDRIVVGCLEEKLFNDTRDEFLEKKTFSTEHYANQDFVINQVRTPL